MNQHEFKAIMTIAKKMHWNSKAMPVAMVIETIKYMICAQQCRDLCSPLQDCDGPEETLLSIATMSEKRLWGLKHEARELQIAMS